MYLLCPFHLSDNSCEQRGALDLFQTLQHSVTVWTGLWSLWTAHCHICPVLFLGPQPVWCLHGEKHQIMSRNLLTAQSKRKKWNQSLFPSMFCVGVCEACAGQEGGGTGPDWHRTQCQSEAGGQHCPLSLRVCVSGLTLSLHALHHWGTVAETPAIHTWSRCPGHPVSTAVPPLLSAGRHSAIRHWCTLILDFSWYLFGSCLWLFVHHSHNPCVQSGITFPPVVKSREVGYSPRL